MRNPGITEERRDPMVGEPKRSEGERSEPEPSGGAPTMGAATPSAPKATPNPEVVAKPSRRKFTAEYKVRVLHEANQCTQPGELGALLRREGLYSSNLSDWRYQREQGSLMALGARKRGRKLKTSDPLMRKVAELKRENLRLEGRLKQAETIIEFQKKVSELLGIPLSNSEYGGKL